jgi:glycosyltransferase involved in cell wall biosynthesis
MILSIILPVTDETVSLRETVVTLISQNRDHIGEVLIVVCRKTTQAALDTCHRLAADYPGLVRVRNQQRPYLGGAMRDAFEWASGSHVLMMASDLETDPTVVKSMIVRAQEAVDIVTASRWMRKDDFHGYSRIKRVANWMFQRMLRVLYGASLSDLTYGFRLFKSEWVKNIEWEELRHPFLLETILKPLRLGACVVEVPATWKVRTEGESHNPFWRNFQYFGIALRTRLRSRKRLLKAALRDTRETDRSVTEALDHT